MRKVNVEKYDKKFIQSVAADFGHPNLSNREVIDAHNACKLETGANYYYALKEYFLN